MLHGFSAHAGRALGRFKSTWYRLVEEHEFANDARTAQIFDTLGKLITTVSPRFRRELNTEGSGMLLDRRVLSYVGVVAGQHRYKFSKHPYGDGIGNCGLIPFRTISVDPNVIRLGSTVRIPETIGMILPDNSVHDGIWYAEDRGGAVRGKRLDFYVGPGMSGINALRKHGIKDTYMVSVEVTDEPQRECVH